MKNLLIIPVFLFVFSCVEVKHATKKDPKADGKPMGLAAEEGRAAATAAGRFRAAFVNPGGMWIPAQLRLEQHRKIFDNMGSYIKATQLTDPLSDPLASVVFLGGCSASFVSPDGLVVTNHHCVQSSLQYNSSQEHNLVENGFLAKTRQQELRASPTQRVMAAQAFRDVTQRMRAGLEKIQDPAMRLKESERRYKQLIAECEKDRLGIRCSLQSFFDGDQYQLIEYMEIRDVRLVYVPKRSVGNYGGEDDNWAWPRHTGDFSFYRAYVGPDGKPAEYSTENVPYQPAHYLKVSTQGVSRGDFVMVTGYPGRTERSMTAAEMKYKVQHYYPYVIAYLKQRYAVIEKLESSPDKNTSIKAGVSKQFTQNHLEKIQGVLAGLTQGDLMQRKIDLDAKIKAWAREPGREKHKADIEKMEQIQAKARKTGLREFDRLFAIGRYGSRLFGTALQLVRMAEERPKKDCDRKPGYQDRDIPDLLAQQKSFARSYDRSLDRALLKLSLLRMIELPDDERPWLRAMLGAKKGQVIDEALIDRTLRRLYSSTRLESESLRVKWLLEGTIAKLRASKDPIMRAALAMRPYLKAYEDEDDVRTGELLLVKPAYTQGMREVLGGFLAPDANATLRITYGTVRGFNPASSKDTDGPFTTADQIITKDRGEKPFDAPQKLLAMIKASNYGPYAVDWLGGKLPVNFLSDLDITGGNSGSPTLNDKGELVGLAFDGTLAGVASDVVFNPESTRTISVDVRYMLWVMDAVDGADHLLEEMGVTPSI